MKIKTHYDRADGVTIIRLEGKLTIGGGDVQLREKVGDVLEEGREKILIDLKGIKMMDSSGLGELVRLRTSAMNAGATVKLLHVEDKVAEVLEMTRLIGVFETFDDEIDAVASFRD